MKSSFMVRVFVVSFVLLQCCVPGPARGELERYDFPACSKKGPPSISVPIANNSLLAKQNAGSKQTDLMSSGKVKSAQENTKAQTKAIANLFKNCNRKLSEYQVNDYAKFILQASEKFNQDPFVIAAVVVSESRARHDAVSKGGDYGLMQVRWRVHRGKIVKKYPHIKNAKDILSPEYNLLIGTEIFSNYMSSCKDLRDGLLRYSSGNGKLVEKVFSVMDSLENTYVAQLKTL